jgi:hypothetical protein
MRSSSCKILTLVIAFMATGFFLLGAEETLAKPEGNPSSTKHVLAKIGDVAWIAGHWGTTLKGSILDEYWSEPAGDCMMGVFRWLRKDKAWLYEMLTIREEEGTLVFRFRHFSDKLNAWEEKDKPLTYRLASLSEREAVFENPKDTDHWRFIFSSPDNKTLVIKVGSTADGTVKYDEFRYTKK